MHNGYIGRSIVDGIEPERARRQLGAEKKTMLRRVLSKILVAGLFVSHAHAAPLLPDMIVWAKDSTISSTCFMYCGTINTTLIDNKVLYRFHGALPNIGNGPLEIREVTHPNNTQDVYQRIHDSVSGITEVLIGSFPNAASQPPRHLWLPGIAQYNLRTVTAGNGVGPIVSSHDKTSMAVVDSLDYDTTLPGAPQDEVYDNVADNILGISIGWADVYPTQLPGQWVEATGLDAGQYWLEVIADPYNRIQESDETNNTTRILVNLFFIPDPLIHPGDYNDDGTVDASDYVVWRNTLGQTVSNYGQSNAALGTGADGDGDGVITAADYDVWRERFGETASGASLPAAGVPEPNVLAIAAAILVLFRPRQIRR
jgi:hypothetical protein